MATVDAVTADAHAKAIVDTYRARSIEGQGAAAVPPDWLTEMQSDIANAINAAVGETVARQDAAATKAKSKAAAAADDDDAPASKASTTHMPATGKHGK